MCVHLRPLLALLVAAAVASLAGCGSNSAVKTYPATGKVVVTGGQDWTGGVVEFESLTNPEHKTMGKIGKNGSFTLETLVEGRRTAGALEGQYRVTVIPPMREDQTGEPVTLSQTFTVEPRENSFTIELPRR